MQAVQRQSCGRRRGKKGRFEEQHPCNRYQMLEAAAVDGFAKCARLTFTELTE